MATIAGVLVRPSGEYAGIWSWVYTVDHKRIGVLYGVTAFLVFLVAGVEAGVMRAQLVSAESTLVSPDVFNQMFTMHATAMVFMVIMPLSAAFFNLLIPLAIGARDVAFPRLNAFSYWVFLFGTLIFHSSFLVNQLPDAGWFSYASLTEKPYSLGAGLDFWSISLLVLGVSSVAAALNFIVTIINMRAPGLSLMRLPVFTWMTLITSILLVLAFPVITVGLVELTMDRNSGPISSCRKAGETPSSGSTCSGLRPPGSLHPDSPSHGSGVRGAPHLFQKAFVRIPVHSVFRPGYRHHELGGVEPPHVYRRTGSGGKLGVHHYHHADCRAHGG